MKSQENRIELMTRPGFQPDKFELASVFGVNLGFGHIGVEACGDDCFDERFVARVPVTRPVPEVRGREEL